MNTKRYALLLTLVCATGIVHASEENKRNHSADNTSTGEPLPEEQRVTFRFAAIESSRSLLLSLACDLTSNIQSYETDITKTVTTKPW